MQTGALIAGKYRVERVLGQGGMGFVFEATHVELDQLVALKTLAAETMTPEGVERFLREARSAARLRSEHVARVIDVGTLESGAPFMVLEHLEGRDLSQLLDDRGPLPVPWVVDLVLQALEGIAEAHAAGIVHRDIKPSNLFLTAAPDGGDLVKVLDFGVSRSERSGADELALTRTATVVGSPAYMSPEQLRTPRGVDARSDIWSLGVALYELVSGRLPFDSEVFGDLCVKVATEDAPPLTEAPPAFAAIVARCLERDRERRWGDVGELAAALAPFAGAPNGAERAGRIARLLVARRSPATGRATPVIVSEHASTLDHAAGSKVTTRVAPRGRGRTLLVAGALAVAVAAVVTVVARGTGPARPAAAPSPPPPAVVVPIPVAAPAVVHGVDAGVNDAAVAPVPRKRPPRPSSPPAHDVYDSRN